MAYRQGRSQLSMLTVPGNPGALLAAPPGTWNCAGQVGFTGAGNGKIITSGAPSSNTITVSQQGVAVVHGVWLDQSSSLGRKVLAGRNLLQKNAPAAVAALNFTGRSRCAADVSRVAVFSSRNITFFASLPPGSLPKAPQPGCAYQKLRRVRLMECILCSHQHGNNVTYC